VLVKVALHFVELEIERPERVAGAFRRRVAGGKLAHAAQRLAGGIVLGHHHANGIADRSAMRGGLPVVRLRRRAGALVSLS